MQMCAEYADRVSLQRQGHQQQQLELERTLTGRMSFPALPTQEADKLLGMLVAPCGALLAAASSDFITDPQLHVLSRTCSIRKTVRVVRRYQPQSLNRLAWHGVQSQKDNPSQLPKPGCCVEDLLKLSNGRLVSKRRQIPCQKVKLRVRRLQGMRKKHAEVMETFQPCCQGLTYKCRHIGIL